MRIPGLELALCGAFALGTAAQTPIDIQPVKELRPNGTLATCNYNPVASETPYFGRLSNEEKTNGSAFGETYSMHGKSGMYVSWFGIVRGISPSAQPGGAVTLLAQHHYFDGETDCHIMLVEKTGDGDFLAKLKVEPAKIPALSLVRVYGRVVSENGSVPEVVVDYVRVWPWFTFTFTDLAGIDHSNPRWQQYTRVKPGDRIYTPYPDENYYLTVLGDPANFGMNFKLD